MKRVLFIFLHVLALQAFSQYAPMSPQVSSAEGLFTPDLYTGSPGVNIPIYTFSARDIQVPVSLSYTGGNGIRVNEEAGWAGLGWHLNAGGFIAQKVRGYNDFDATGYIGSSKKLPCIEGDKTWPLQGTDQNDCFGNNANLTAQDLKDYDLEPDLFILTMPGYNIKFFYNKQGNVFISSASTLSIVMSQPAGSGFTVKTQNGLSYNFSMAEKCYEEAATDLRFKLQGTTWYLSTITSDITGEVVTFSYVNNSPAPADRLKQNTYSQTVYQKQGAAPSNMSCYVDAQSIWTTTGADCFGCQLNANYVYGDICPEDFCSGMASALSKPQIRIFSSDLIYLNSISSSSNTGKIYFNKTGRDDIGNANTKKLDEIVVTTIDEKNVETNLARYKFSYDYFTSMPYQITSGCYYAYAYPGYEGKRLKLVSVQQKSGDGLQSLPAYNFTYLDNYFAGNPNLPYKTSFDIDNWGYYNNTGSASNTGLAYTGAPGINRNSDGYSSSANLLKKVQYPEGGWLEFTYDNTPGHAGARLYKVSNYETGSANPLVKTYSYQANGSYNMIQVYGLPVDLAQSLTLETCSIVNVDYNLGYTYTGKKLVKNQSQVLCHFNAYTSSNSLSFSDMSGISPQNYTMVTELIGANGDAGKTEYYFPVVQYPIYDLTPMNKNPLEGLVNRKIIYKKVSGLFVKVSEETYDYDFGPNVYTNTTANGLKTFKSYTDEDNTSTNEANIFTTVNISGYIMKTAQLQSLTTTSVLYDQNDPNKSTSAVSVQKYDAYGLLKESYTNNNPVTGFGNYSRTYRYYERSSGAGNLLKFKPVETISFAYTGNISGNPVKKDFANSFIQYNSTGLPEQVWVSNALTTPSAGLTPADISYRKTSILAYEPLNNNPVQQAAVLQENVAGGYNNTFLKNSTIWGYKNSLPVASVVNADLSQVAYNGFESGALPVTNNWDGGTAGNIIIDQTNAADKDNVFTGRFAVKMGPASASNPNVYSPTVNLNPASQTGKYKMSCWVKIPGYIGQNKAFIKMQTYQTGGSYTLFPTNSPAAYAVAFTDYTRHDWQYVEIVLDLGAAKSIVPGVNLSIRCFAINQDLNNYMLIDDIRIHPLDAQMATYTYKPGYGKSSEAGADSKPVNYEYDGLGRLKYIRDFRTNILKKYQYYTKY